MLQNITRYTRGSGGTYLSKTHSSIRWFEHVPIVEPVEPAPGATPKATRSIKYYASVSWWFRLRFRLKTIGNSCSPRVHGWMPATWAKMFGSGKPPFGECTRAVIRPTEIGYRKPISSLKSMRFRTSSVNNQPPRVACFPRRRNCATRAGGDDSSFRRERVRKRSRRAFVLSPGPGGGGAVCRGRLRSIRRRGRGCAGSGIRKNATAGIPLLRPLNDPSTG